MLPSHCGWTASGRCSGTQEMSLESLSPAMARGYMSVCLCVLKCKTTLKLITTCSRSPSQFLHRLTDLTEVFHNSNQVYLSG